MRSKNGENVKHHPSNHVPLASKDEHKRLKTIHGTNHDERDDRNGFALADGRNDQVNDLSYMSNAYGRHRRGALT